MSIEHNKLEVGIITKPQGLRGEVKIRAYTATPERFLELEAVYIDDRLIPILSRRIVGNAVFLQFEGVNDRTAAEAIVGKTLLIDRSQARPLDADSYFIVDLLGCNVFVGDQFLGQLEDIGQYGAADVHTVLLSDGRRVRYPFLRKLVIDVDISAGRIVLDSTVFDEVSVYED